MRQHRPGREIGLAPVADLQMPARHRRRECAADPGVEREFAGQTILPKRAVLTHLRADISGDRDRVTVREFSAKDTGSGALDLRGSLALAGGAPSADLAATLQNFRILGRDEGVLTASGVIRIAGPVASPRVTAQLTGGEGDLRIPDNLPAGVTKLQVVEINSREGRPRPASRQVPPPPPARPGAGMPPNLCRPTRAPREFLPHSMSKSRCPARCSSAAAVSTANGAAGSRCRVPAMRRRSSARWKRGAGPPQSRAKRYGV